MLDFNTKDPVSNLIGVQRTKESMKSKDFKLEL